MRCASGLFAFSLSVHRTVIFPCPFSMVNVSVATYGRSWPSTEGRPSLKYEY
jgi:hypothetical protein